MISWLGPSRTGRLAAILVSALALIGCGGTQQPTATPAAPPPTGDIPGFTLDVQNNSQSPICYLFMVPTSYETDWGSDQLGSDIIDVGQKLSLNGIAEGQYDIKTEDCDHNVISWNFDQTINTDSVLTVEGGADQLIIQNTGEQSICAVWAWISGDVMWPRAQVYDTNTPIVPGSQRSIPLRAGDWNLRIQTCDGNAQDYTLPITGPTLLTYPPTG